MTPTAMPALAPPERPLEDEDGDDDGWADADGLAELGLEGFPPNGQ